MNLEQVTFEDKDLGHKSLPYEVSPSKPRQNQAPWLFGFEGVRELREESWHPETC